MSHKQHMKLAIGGMVVLLSLSYLIYGGLEESLVYFVTPSELLQKGAAAYERPFRLGGLVVRDSLVKQPDAPVYRFVITDGSQVVPVSYRGIPPDLFAEGRGAIVEGTFTAQGIFQAKTILAKHSEEYSPAEEESSLESAQKRVKSLITREENR
ncbi:MAG: cytochrome c maturation protein CcmE [Candidatus Tectomicrobia bacterium]|nr:cytochrome c maturation protein CcmE [Candidatus Tectomicrobia bacterium]